MFILVRPLHWNELRTSFASLQPKKSYHTPETSYASPTSRFEYHYENTLTYDLAEKLMITNAHETPKLKKIILSSSVSFKPQQTRGISDESVKVISSVKKSTTSKGSGNRSGHVVSQGLQDCTLQVRKALILLSGQNLDPKTFRVARPHLGIREGRLAAYQVTLRDEAMFSFLERLLTDVIPKIMKTDLASLVTGSSDRRLQQSSMKLSNFKVKDEPIKLTTSDWLNDGSRSKLALQSFFDGNGNFQVGIPNFYLFREIEQNMEFTKLNGLNVTIVTTAKTDHEARLLLSGFQAPFRH